MLKVYSSCNGGSVQKRQRQPCQEVDPTFPLFYTCTKPAVRICFATRFKKNHLPLDLVCSFDLDLGTGWLPWTLDLAHGNLDLGVATGAVEGAFYDFGHVHFPRSRVLM